jgi:hypothetical protein
MAGGSDGWLQVDLAERSHLSRRPAAMMPWAVLCTARLVVPDRPGAGPGPAFALWRVLPLLLAPERGEIEVGPR